MMPNGKCYRPYRLPGMYCCTVCRDLKDAEEFYKDSSRYNGCSSRCKECQKKRGRERYRWTKLWLKKHIDQIKSVQSKVVQKDRYGLPIWIERTIYFENGSYETTFEKGLGAKG